MADQFQIPQRSPQYVAPVAPPTDLIQALYNRPKPGEIAAQNIGQGVNSLLENYYKQNQLKAGAFEAGGPYLMQMLYGNRQSGQLPQPQGAQQMSQAGSTQLPPNLSVPQSGNQPLMHESGIPQTIHESVANGNADNWNHVNQSKPNPMDPTAGLSDDVLASGYFGKYGTGVLDGRSKAASIRAANSKFATPEQGAAIAGGDPSAIARTYPGGQAPVEAYQYAGNKTLERGKAVTGIAEKAAPQMTQIKNLQSAYDQIAVVQGDPNNKSIPFTGGLGAKYVEMNPKTKSKWATNQYNAEQIADVGAGAIEKLVEGRYNDQQMQRIKASFFPTGNELGTQIGDQKLARLKNYINQMRQGTIDQAQSSLDALAGGGFNPGAMGTPAPFPSTSSNSKAINSQAQYEALPMGASYTWNGKPHIKGRS